MCSQSVNAFLRCSIKRRTLIASSSLEAPLPRGGRTKDIVQVLIASTHDYIWSTSIHPICITILYHNLPLFIDICIIMRYYLWLFICLCMLDDSWRMDWRSLDSDGKEGI